MKTILLTGASRGLGRAIARALDAADDVSLVLAVRDRAAGEQVAASLRRPAEVVELDVSSIEAVTRFGAGWRRPLHALVNNAGISPKTPIKERLGCLNGSLEGWHRVFELNFFAPLVLARGFAAPLSRAKGAIVNVTSIAGHAVHPFAGSAYSTSKAALSGLTREMAVEFAEINVRVNAVAPGEIETAMTGPEYDVLIPRIPLKRMGTPEDVAAVVFYLCGPDAGYVTGTEIFITGGQHLF